MTYWWRIQKYARVTFGKSLKTVVVSLVSPEKMNSPPVSVLAMFDQYLF